MTTWKQRSETTQIFICDNPARKRERERTCFAVRNQTPTHYALGPEAGQESKVQGGVHRPGELNSSIKCDSFGTVSKCGASDGMVSQDALDPVYRCAATSTVSASSSRPAGTQ